MLIPKKVKLTIYQGATLYQVFPLVDGNGLPFDFTGWTARMQVRQTPTSVFAFLDLTTENGGLKLLSPPGGESAIELYTIPERTVQIPGGSHFYDILLANAAGHVGRVQEGPAEVSPGVTRSAVPVEESVTISKTELDITDTIGPGTAFSVVASGTGYTKTGANGNLGISEAFFNDSIQIQIELDGVRVDKTDDITWISSQSFSFVSATVDAGDKITIFS